MQLLQDGNPTNRGEETHRPCSHERAANTAEEQLLLIIVRVQEALKFVLWLDGCCRMLSNQDYIEGGTGWNGGY
jgi:hypothetical protein